jgi:hypothetical protein
MSLQELDEVVVSRQFPALDGFPVGWDPRLWPGYFETADLVSC